MTYRVVLLLGTAVLVVRVNENSRLVERPHLNTEVIAGGQNVLHEKKDDGCNVNTNIKKGTMRQILINQAGSIGA